MQEKKARVNDLKSELLHRLRDVFEKVDGARQLIEAHRSAKTYSEQIRNNIFPSISVLFDIKRSVADAKDTLEIEDVDKFRVGIHFMAAYLQALANEYKKKYPDISNMQFVHEKIKAEARDRFVTKALQGKENLTNDELSINSIPQPPTWVWDTIKELPYMGTFINDTYDSAYRKMFVDFYDECKRLLKGIVMKEEKEKKRLAWYDPKYIDTIHKIDDGSVNASLIDILIKELDKKIAESKEKNNVKTASVQQLVEIYESD
jgi:hypothetical protein